MRIDINHQVEKKSKRKYWRLLVVNCLGADVMSAYAALASWRRALYELLLNARPANGNINVISIWPIAACCPRRLAMAVSSDLFAWRHRANLRAAAGGCARISRVNVCCFYIGMCA